MKKLLWPANFEKKNYVICYLHAIFSIQSLLLCDQLFSSPPLTLSLLNWSKNHLILDTGVDAGVNDSTENTALLDKAGDFQKCTASSYV